MWIHFVISILQRTHNWVQIIRRIFVGERVFVVCIDDIFENKFEYLEFKVFF